MLCSAQSEVSRKYFLKINYLRYNVDMLMYSSKQKYIYIYIFVFTLLPGFAFFLNN